MDPKTLSIVLTMSIPIIAILGGFVMEWLKLREKQKTLGTSNREMEQKVERLERANAEYARRLENLETIVVSQSWSALNNAPGVSAVRHEVHTPPAEEVNRQRAEQLARRLGG